MNNPYEFNPKGSILDDQLAVSGIENDIFGFIADVFTGGAYTRNKQNEKIAAENNRAQAEAYQFEGKELERAYEYEKEGLKIAKKNAEENLSFQEKERQQSWNYGMAIRDYEHSRELLEYDQSLTQFTQQTGFNEVAEGFATLQQDRYLMEQQIELALDKKENYLDYVTTVHGLGLQKRKTRLEAASQQRELSLSEMKAKGAQRARGQVGRSNIKALQAITAEYDAKERDLIDALMLDTAKIDLDTVQRQQQLNIENFAFEMTKNNLLAADQFTRKQIQMQRLQADIDAEANLLLKPALAPPLPAPIALPRPEFQEIYEPAQGPIGAKFIAPRESLASAFVGTTFSYAAPFIPRGGGN
jgi:hypothetical protein